MKQKERPQNGAYRYNDEQEQKNCRFDYETVEICRNCSGKGWVKMFDNSSDHTTHCMLRLLHKAQPEIKAIRDNCHTSGVAVQCPICKGTGRVVKRTAGSVVVQPYKDQMPTTWSRTTDCSELDPQAYDDNTDPFEDCFP